MQKQYQKNKKLSVINTESFKHLAYLPGFGLFVVFIDFVQPDFLSDTLLFCVLDCVLDCVFTLFVEFCFLFSINKPPCLILVFAYFWFLYQK